MSGVLMEKGFAVFIPTNGVCIKCVLMSEVRIDRQKELGRDICHFYKTTLPY